MRASFIKTLVEIAANDPRVMLLTGDLGYCSVEPFSERYPERFLNVGIAEQNMVGVATGLAEAGFIPFVYSIVTFATLRAYEFIRNGPISHRLPVRIVGIGGGFEYGCNGKSHYGLEDLGIMRIQPGITVVCPSDFEQARNALLATWNLPGPLYYRIGKDEKYLIPGLEGRFHLDRAERIREGGDLLMICTGSVAREAAAAAERLSSSGIQPTVVVVSCLQPAPVKDLESILAHFPLALTIEGHYHVGGLGSLVSEIIAERGLACRLVRCGAKAMPSGVCGGQDYMHEKNGLSIRALVETARLAIG